MREIPSRYLRHRLRGRRWFRSVFFLPLHRRLLKTRPLPRNLFLMREKNRPRIDRSKSPVRFNGAVEVAVERRKNVYTEARICNVRMRAVGRSPYKAFNQSTLRLWHIRNHRRRATLPWASRCSRVDLFYRLCQAPSVNPRPFVKIHHFHVRVTRAEFANPPILTSLPPPRHASRRDNYR